MEGTGCRGAGWESELTRGSCSIRRGDGPWRRTIEVSDIAGGRERCKRRTYLNRACLDTAKLADEGCCAGFEEFTSTGVELSRAGQDVGRGSCDGGSSEEGHGGSSEDGGELHIDGWVWKTGVLKFGRLVD